MAGGTNQTLKKLIRASGVKTTTSEVRERIGTTALTISKIQRELDTMGGKASRPAGAVSVEHMTATLAQVDRAGKHGGLVPLHELRKATGLDHGAFHSLMLKAEREYKVDLKVAHDTRGLNKAESIQRTDPSGRHNVYWYAVKR